MKHAGTLRPQIGVRNQGAAIRKRRHHPARADSAFPVIPRREACSRLARVRILSRGPNMQKPIDRDGIRKLR